MTDKQIIIDGVDVSNLTGKQLVCMNRYEIARLFAKLIDALIKIEDDYNNAQDDRVRMWTDNTVLTEKLKRKEQECEALRDEKAYANIACEQFEKQINEYSQTLTEIKEIAEVDFNHTCWKTYAKQLEQILQKIDEVLNDR